MWSKQMHLMRTLLDLVRGMGGGGKGRGFGGKEKSRAVLLGKLKGAQCSKPAKSRVPSICFA